MDLTELQTALTEIPLLGPLFSGSVLVILFRVLGLVIAVFVGMKLLNWAWGKGEKGADSERSLIKQGRYEDAGDLASRRGDLVTALKHYKSSNAWLKAGHIARRLGQTRDAASFFEKAREIKLAVAAYEACGQEEHSARLAAQTSDPSLLAKAAIWHEKVNDPLKAGTFFAKAGRLKDAERCFLSAGAEGREYAIRMFVTAFKERRMGSSNDAKKLAFRAATLLGEAGQRQQAIHLCHQAGINPKNVEILNKDGGCDSASGLAGLGAPSSSSRAQALTPINPRSSRDDLAIDAPVSSPDSLLDVRAQQSPPQGAGTHQSRESGSHQRPREARARQQRRDDDLQFRESSDRLQSPRSSNNLKLQDSRGGALLHAPRYRDNVKLRSRENHFDDARPYQDIVSNDFSDDTIPDDDLGTVATVSDIRGQLPQSTVDGGKVKSVVESYSSLLQVARRQSSRRVRVKKPGRPKTEDVAEALLMVLDKEDSAVADFLLPELNDDEEYIGNQDHKQRRAAVPRILPDQSSEESFGFSSDVTSRYSFLARIGSGGMGEVFKVKDLTLGREVALKFLSKSMVGDELAMRFFLREARAAAALNHPAIVTVYDIGVLDGRPFICMEYVEGTDLGTRIQAQGPIEYRHAINLTVQLAMALDFAHERNVVHRDIKPANVIQARGGVVKVLDFGLAKAILGGPKKSTVVAGTPDYMSPEQLAGRGVDGRTDIYSMGVLLYEILTNTLPFDGALRSSDFELPSSRASWLPPAVDEIVVKALAMEKEDRFQRGREFADALRAILKG